MIYLFRKNGEGRFILNAHIEDRLVDILNSTDRKEHFEKMSKEDIRAVLSLAKKHKLYLYIYNCISNAFGKGGFESLLQEKALYIFYIEIIRKQITALEEISVFFETNGIDYIIIKGVPQAYKVYGNPYLRDPGDIDIVVRKEQVEEAYKILIDLGYYPKACNDEWTTKGVSINSWETVLIKKFITIELKWASSAIRFKFERLFDYTYEIYLAKKSVRTLSNVGTIVHSLANTYVNNEGRNAFKDINLRDYYECHALLKCVYSDDHIDRIIELMTYYEMLHKAYEVLRSLNDLFKLTNKEAYIMNKCRLFNCMYDLGTEGWSGADANRNAGLLFDGHKANAIARIFDADYSMHVFGKNLKNAIYNKHKHENICLFLNDDYVYRLIYDGVETITFSVRNRRSLIISIIGCDIKTSLNSYIFELVWYEKDINLCPLFSGIEVELSKVIRHGECTCSVVSTGFFKNDEYVQDCLFLTNEYARKGNIIVKLEMKKTQEIISVEIPLILLPIDVASPSIVMDLALKKKINTTTFSKGVKTVMIIFKNTDDAFLKE